MFGTIRYGSSRDASSFDGSGSGAILQLQPAQATSGFFPPHAACDICRAKKLRCSGQKPVCDRCNATKAECWYTQAAEKRKRGHSSRSNYLSDETLRATVRANAASKTDDSESKSGGSLQPINSSPKSPSSNKRMISTTAEKLLHSRRDGMDISIETGLNGYEHNNVGSDRQDSVFTPFDTSTVGLFQSSQQHPDDEAHPHDFQDSLETPNLDISTWYPLLSFSPDSTVDQHQGNGRDGQILARSYSESSVSDSTSLTFLTSHEIESHENYNLDAAHGILRHIPSPILSSHSSPARTPSTPRAGRPQVTTIRSQTPSHTLKHAPSAQLSTFSNMAEERLCSCLQDVAALLDDLALSDPTKIRQSFDVTLGYLKSVLEQCNSALECMRCIGRSEYCMLLAVLIEKLVSASEKAAREHILTPSSRNIDIRSSDGSSRITAAAESAQFGSYSLSSTEHQFLVRGLMKLHLESCRALVVKLIHIARLSRREGQEALLLEIEQHIDRIQTFIKDMSHTPDDGLIYSIKGN